MSEQNVRVLFVEDSKGDAAFVKLCLGQVDDPKSVKYDVIHVASVADALKRLAKGTFDVILLDLCVSDSRELATFRAVYHAAPVTPIVLMTGMDEEHLIKAALSEGAQDFLVKGRTDRYMLERSIRYAIERKRALESIRETEERYDLALRGANDGIWDWNLKTGEIFFSARWKEMLGYAEGELRNDPQEWFDRIHPDDVKTVREHIARHQRGETPHFECEYLMRHRNGANLWVLSRGSAVFDAAGKACRVAGSQTDITDRKRAELQLRHEALHDSLTNLPNRALLTDHIRRAIAQARRKRGFKFALLFIDLDRFKVINDSLGHVVGDQLLSGVAARLEQLIRPMDTIARLGGDEFVILLDNVRDANDATRVAARVHETLEKPFQLSGSDVTTSASIGIALSDTGYEKPEEVIRDADTAMYRAKALGKVRHEIFDSAMHQSAMLLLKLEGDLRRAVERQEFRVHYQPIVALQTGKLSGFEALLRWQHPERGMIYPGEFLSTAEETGLMAQLDMWVMREACGRMKEWIRRVPSCSTISISVNLSPRQLGMAGLADDIRRLLLEVGLAPENMRLEITEGMILEPTEAILANLRALRGMGLRLQLDDFGTGYCSLSYLHRYPIDNMKIDRSFIQNISENRDNLEIVRTIAMLAKNLKMDVIAEGVETAEQFELLKGLGIQHGQGYYFSKAICGADASDMIASGFAA